MVAEHRPDAQRLNHRAAIALRVIAFFQITHVVFAIALAPPEKRTWGVIVGGISLNLLLVGLLLFVSRGVRHGRRLTGAVCLAWFLVMGALMAGGVANGMGYTGGLILASFQIVFMLILWWAAITVTRAAMVRSFGPNPSNKRPS